MQQINPNLTGIVISATLAINEKSRELASQGKTIYRLGLGQSPFPVPRSVVAELRRNAGRKEYLPVNGLPALRKAVAKHHASCDRIQINPNNILIGPGSKELQFLLQLVFNGEIILPSPCWVSYLPQARILGRPTRILPTRREDGWRIDPKELDGLCSEITGQKLIILNYPANPTGTTYDERNLKEIASVVRKHDLIILSDEIYGLLHHSGKHISIARYYPERTIISSGLSKWCGAGGWRLGTFAFPETLEELRYAMLNVASETYTSVSTPIQYAAVTAFEGGRDIQSYIRHCRTILSALGSYCSKILDDAGVPVFQPQGGFYLFADFGRCKGRFSTSRQLCDALLKDTGVAILPGDDFLHPEEELTARIAYVDFDGGAALDASMKSGEPLNDSSRVEFIEKHCGRVVKAMDLIVEWVQ